MSKKRRIQGEYCPICDRAYSSKRYRTKHHIFPKFFYGFTDVTVFACCECHTREFHNKLNRMDCFWNPQECIDKWVAFCKQKGKNAYKIYPILKKLLQ